MGKLEAEVTQLVRKLFSEMGQRMPADVEAIAAQVCSHNIYCSRMPVALCHESLYTSTLPVAFHHTLILHMKH